MAIIGTIFIVAQQLGAVGYDLQAPKIAGIGNEIVIRRTFALVRQAVAFRIQAQPIAILETSLPKAVFAALAVDIIHPNFHAFVLLVDHPAVAVGFIQRPWYCRSGIAPVGSAVLAAADTHAENIRHHLHHAAGCILVCRQIPQPLAHEWHHISVDGSGGCKCGGIASPAQPFAALGAIRGHIQIIVPLAPQNIFPKSIDPAVRASKMGRLLQVRGQMAGFQGDLLPFFQALQANIAETMEGEMGAKPLLGSI